MKTLPTKNYCVTFRTVLVPKEFGTPVQSYLTNTYAFYSCTIAFRSLYFFCISYHVKTYDTSSNIPCSVAIKHLSSLVSPELHYPPVRRTPTSDDHRTVMDRNCILWRWSPFQGRSVWIVNATSRSQLRDGIEVYWHLRRVRALTLRSTIPTIYTIASRSLHIFHIFAWHIQTLLFTASKSCRPSEGRMKYENYLICAAAEILISRFMLKKRRRWFRERPTTR